ncbi:MAG TPA: SCO family protein [Nocardioides sp.]|nr:SCO family protein [Nocardioides sp.]
MSSSRRSRLPTALSLGLGLVMVLGACGSSGPPAPESGGVGTVVDRAMPSSIGALRLRDSSGHVVSLDSFHGKTLVISDSMTLCSEDCPLDTANVTAAAKAADAAGLGDKVEFLTVTVDPARDDRHHLDAYRGLYDPHRQLPNWELLTGDQSTLTELWKYFGVFWKKVPEASPPDHDWLTGKPLTYDIAHSDDVLMIDPSGHERYVIQGHAYVSASGRVPATMRSYLSPAGRRHLYRPGDATWTPGDVLQGVSWLTGRHVSLAAS